jgi:Coenzyme PQQ synthesis protein D (PqqD)
MSMDSKYIAKIDSVASRYLGEELIIMSAIDSKLFSLNPCAAAIWEAADGRSRLSEIVQHSVCAKFEVGPQQALADAEQFVEELSAHGILIVSDEPLQDR